MKMTYTRDMIEAIVREVIRRQEMDMKHGDYDTYPEAHDGLLEKMQGAYGAVMVTSDDWPQCVRWFNEFENEYHIMNYYEY